MSVVKILQLLNVEGNDQEQVEDLVLGLAIPELSVHRVVHQQDPMVLCRCQGKEYS